MNELNNLINNNHILAMYEYGSSVYGNKTNLSDNDYIVITKDKNLVLPNIKNVDFNVYTEEEFIKLINDHEITALECLFLSNEKKLKETIKWDFTLDVQKLRTSISAKSSNSWVKAKKKFIIEKDFNPYIGKKSAWHALRMLDFGIQIAQNGKIINYSSLNYLYNEIISVDSWESLDKNFREEYKKLSTQFKLSAPKLINANKFKM